MTIKSIKENILGVINFFNLNEDTSGFVDQSFGKMTKTEVLQMVFPFAEQAHYIYKSDSYSCDYQGIGLFSDTKNNKLIWIVNFAWTEVNGEILGDHLDTQIASIKVDDENGEIKSVWQRGMKTEMSFSDFLDLLKSKHRINHQNFTPVPAALRNDF